VEGSPDRPPDYLVLEPEDTAARTANLRQTNTNGYKFQGTEEQFRDAQHIIQEWGADGSTYSPTPEYQALSRKLIARFSYRLDTNFAKMDRIVHTEIEAFKRRIHNIEFHGSTIREWNRLLSKGREDEIRIRLANVFDIHDNGQAIVE
jgi:hypothetical protein